MAQLLVSVWQVLLVLQAVGSHTSALSLRRMRKTQVGSASSEPSNSGDAAGLVPGSLVAWGPSPDPTTTTTITTSSHLSTTAPAPFIHYPTANTTNSVLSSLFQLGLSDIEEQGAINSERESPLRNLIKDLGNMTSIPLAAWDGPLSLDDDDAAQDKTLLLQYLDGIRNDAWAQFKSMILGYTEFLEREYEEQERTDELPLDLIKKILDLGDGMNFLHVLGRDVDPELPQYLMSQLQPLLSRLSNVNTGRTLGESVSSIIGTFVRSAAWKSLRYFVNHVLSVAEDYVSREELEEYSAELTSSIPIVAEGLDLILNDPARPSVTREGRFLASWLGYGGGGYGDGYGNDNRVGYGGYGAYGDSYGTSSYKYGIYLDPYLVLAGIGAAALLSFLAQKIVMMTPMPGRHLGSDYDLTRLMGLSDSPGVVGSLHTALEAAGDKYESKRSSGSQMDDLIHQLNSLWWESKKDAGCLRCLVFNLTASQAHATHNLLRDLTLVVVAHLLGSERSGQLLDEVTSLRLKGTEPVTCEREANTCRIKGRQGIS
ncbi:uncharacterized protein [Panulirus ornatus]|uniref:uncharacterized protein n=1 Tax=Panulirus ornatus TaxID=150431 RepID=UPI003A856D3A